MDRSLITALKSRGPAIEVLALHLLEAMEQEKDVDVLWPAYDMAKLLYDVRAQQSRDERRAQLKTEV